VSSVDYREVFVTLLVDVLRDPRVQEALHGAPAALHKGNLLTTEQMASELGCGKSTLIRAARRVPELRALKTPKGWRRQAVKEAWERLRGSVPGQEE
jgi:hypothetical protein